MTRMRNTWILPASIFIALVLGLLPLPMVVQPLRPYWLALVLAYWVIEEPDRVGLGLAFVAGVLADLLYGGLLGEQALRLVIMTFILQRFRARMRFSRSRNRRWPSAGCCSTTASCLRRCIWPWASQPCRGATGGRRCWAWRCGRRCSWCWMRCGWASGARSKPCTGAVIPRIRMRRPNSSAVARCWAL